MKVLTKGTVRRSSVGKERKTLLLCGQDVYVLGMMIALISFLGFLVENLWLALTKGYINNRNMNAPFLVGYGMLVVAMYFLFGTPDEMNLPKRMRKRATTRYRRYALYFLGAMLFVCIGEIVLGVCDSYCKLSKGKSSMKLQKDKRIFASGSETTYWKSGGGQISKSKFNKELKKLVGSKKMTTIKLKKFHSKM